jgi:hypothetical protein
MLTLPIVPSALFAQLRNIIRSMPNTLTPNPATAVTTTNITAMAQMYRHKITMKLSRFTGGQQIIVGAFCGLSDFMLGLYSRRKFLSTLFLSVLCTRIRSEAQTSILRWQSRCIGIPAAVQNVADERFFEYVGHGPTDAGLDPEVTGFNKKAVAGGRCTFKCPFGAGSTACTPPVHEPSGLIGASPSV